MKNFSTSVLANGSLKHGGRCGMASSRNKRLGKNSANIGPSLQTKSNKHVNSKLRLKFFNAVFGPNRWILCDPKVSIAQKIEYFDRVISPIACFAAAHRPVYRNDLHKMDVAYRRLLRSVVGPPRNIDGLDIAVA